MLYQVLSSCTLEFQTQIAHIGLLMEAKFQTASDLLLHKYTDSPNLDYVHHLYNYTTAKLL